MFAALTFPSDDLAFDLNAVLPATGSDPRLLSSILLNIPDNRNDQTAVGSRLLELEQPHAISFETETDRRGGMVR